MNESLTAWEPVDAELDAIGDPLSTTDRSRVPGGWLYRTVVYGNRDHDSGIDSAVALAFVPDAGAGSSRQASE